MSAIRLAQPADVSSLARILAKAFLDDPFARWMLGTRSAPEQALQRLYGKVVSLNLLHHSVYTNDERTAAAVWRPHDRWKLSLREEWSMFRTTLRVMGLGRFLRLLPGLLAVQRRHPVGPYAQLFVLGVEPEARGRGLASKLLRPILSDCDAHGVRAYLETSKDTNIPIYQRYGFQVTDVLEVPRGPRVYAMWREPV
jgi:ribosomal protein S18 acetylase RimI-like enzyme